MEIALTVFGIAVVVCAAVGVRSLFNSNKLPSWRMRWARNLNIALSFLCVSGFVAVLSIFADRMV